MATQTSGWLERMQEETRSDPRLRDALALLFRTLDSPALARCQSVEDWEELVAKIDRRASLDAAEWFELPETQSKIRRQALAEYIARIWRLHRKQITRKQICQSLQVDPSDFRKYLNGKKFSLQSAVAQRIGAFLLSDCPPTGS